MATYTLTSGNDTITAGDGDTIVLSDPNQLNAGDVVTGTAGAVLQVARGPVGQPAQLYDLTIPGTFHVPNLVDLGWNKVKLGADNQTVAGFAEVWLGTGVASITGNPQTSVFGPSTIVGTLVHATPGTLVAGTSLQSRPGAGLLLQLDTAGTYDLSQLSLSAAHPIAINAHVDGITMNVDMASLAGLYAIGGGRSVVTTVTTSDSEFRWPIGSYAEDLSRPATVRLRSTAPGGTTFYGGGSYIDGGVGSTIHTGSSRVLDLRDATLINVPLIVAGDNGFVLGGPTSSAVTIRGGAGADTISGNRSGDTLTGGGAGDLFHDTAANLNGSTITDFQVGDIIDLTDLAPSGATASFAGGVLTVRSGATTANITLSGVTSGTFTTVTNFAGSGTQVMLAKAVAGGPGNHVYRGTAAELQGATLTDFKIGDVIALTDQPYSSMPASTSIANGVLTVQTSPITTIQMFVPGFGGVSASAFRVGSDGQGGTTVRLLPSQSGVVDNYTALLDYTGPNAATGYLRFPGPHISYSFMTPALSAARLAQDGLDGFVPFTADQQQAVRRILASISDVAQVNFHESPDTPSTGLKFANANLYGIVGGIAGGSASGLGIIEARAYVDAAGGVQDMTPGGAGYARLLQATLSALGLKHTQDIFGDGSVSQPYLDAAHDSRLWTAMSMNGYGGFGGLDRSTLGQFDVLALQALYGWAPGTRTGDTTYGFNATADTASRPEFNFALTPAPVISIWDAGGNNTLDVSGYATNAYIDLAGLSSVGGLTNNISIVPGSRIATAIGGAGNDTIVANDGGNRLVGGAGDDILRSGAGADTLDGGAGTNTTSYASSSAGVTVNLATGSVAGGAAQGDVLVNIRSIAGSAFDDALTAAVVGSAIAAGSGADTLVAGAGADTLDGGAGIDVVSYAASGSGVTVNLATGTATGGLGNDALSGLERVIGSGFADHLTGAGIDARLVGGAGADTLLGSGGAAADYGLDSAGVTVNLATNVNTGGDAQGDSIDGIANVIGGAGNDGITGNGRANRLWGGGGNDTLDAGGGGNDSFLGGAGSDRYTGFAGGRDTIGDFEGAAGGDTLMFSGETLSVRSLSLAEFVWMETSGGEVGVTLDATPGTYQTIWSGGWQGWRVVGVADINGDGQADIVSQRASDGYVGVSIMAGATPVSFQTIWSSYSWSAVGVGDIDGDGRADILFQQPNGGEVGLHIMHGTTNAGYQRIWEGLGPNWRMAGVGDLNGDGKADILLRSVTGDIGVHLMNGVSSWQPLQMIWTAQPEAWRIVALADMNSDGRDDVVWQNDSNGQVQVSFMNGATPLGSEVLWESQPSNWRIVGAGDVVRQPNSVRITYGSGASVDVVGSARDLSLIANVAGHAAISADSLWRVGTAGGDSLLGGVGAETLEGGAGADMLDGGAGGNAATYAGSSAGVTVNLATGTGAGGDAQGDVLSNVRSVFGSAFDDTLTAAASGSLLYGGAGSDSLRGGAGNDTLEGGVGNDTLVGSGGADRYLFGRGDGQDSIVNGGGSGSAAGILALGTGVTTNQLWLRRSGNDLVAEIMGTTSRATVSGWYASAGAQLQRIVTADGSMLDGQLNALVSAMASFQAANPGFDPTASSNAQAPADATLQAALAAAWHH